MTSLPALTGVRGIAAWFVVLYHIRTAMAWLPAPIAAVLAKGYLAVDLFFMLSGFVLWLNYADRLRESGLAGAPAFWWRRFARIWPLHAVMLAGATTFALSLVATGRADPVAWPLGEWPLHLTLTQNWGFTDRLSWNHPAWSISTELAAYLLFPLLALAVDWRRIASPLIRLTVAVLIIELRLIMGVSLSSDIVHLGLARCLIEFVIGTALCGLWARHRAQAALPATLVCATAAAAWASGAPETLAVPALLGSALLLIATTRNALARPLALWLGEISYATYLVHFLLWIGFKLVFVGDPVNLPPGLIFLFLALVLAASAVLHRLVERPAQAWLNGIGRSPLPRQRERAVP